MSSRVAGPLAAGLCLASLAWALHGCGGSEPIGPAPALSGPAGLGLTKEALDVAVTVSSAPGALRFYGDGLGLRYRGDAAGTPGLRMLLFEAGDSTLKVRVYESPPPAYPGEVAAANGWRFVSVRVSDVPAVAARLTSLGFTSPTIDLQGGVRLAWTRDADGNVVEIAEAAAGSRWGLGVGLLVPDLAAAREFLSVGLGLPTGSGGPGLPVSGEAGDWFTAGRSAIRLHAPPGSRPTRSESVAGAMGFRYVTFNVADVDAVYERLRARGTEIAVPPATYGDAARILMARGPGGALFEFVGPAAPTTVQPTPSPSPIGGGPTGGLPEARPPAGRAFLDLAFTTDYHAARVASSSLLAQVTECNALAAHRGALFAATSYMPAAGATDPKILVKRTAAGPWEVEHRAGSAFMRIGILKSIGFTTDSRGQRLPVPVPVLVAGLGSWRSQQPDGVYVLTRDDARGAWVKTKLSDQVWNPEQMNHSTEVRQVFDHVDRVTGVHHVFAGSAIGSLFQGAYDPAVPGGITWEAVPELSGLMGHFVSGAAEIDGVLYAGVAYGPMGDEPRPTERLLRDHGLFRRVDGPRARWEWVPVLDWEDPARPGFSRRIGQLRGLTAVADPSGSGRDVLLLAWDTSDAVIERVDPALGLRVSVELDLRAYFRQAWGRSVGVSTFAYNDMLPSVHPDTGEAVHLIGLWLVHPDGEASEIGRSSWYLVRYSDASYGYGRVYDPADLLAGLPYGLRGTRSVLRSPFAGESERTWYFGGFDQTGIGGPDARGSTAWIYRGRLPAPAR